MDVGSLRTLSLAKAALDECVVRDGKHAQCVPFAISDSDIDNRPTRVIDCGPESLQSLRLVSTKDLSHTLRGQPFRYITLSYVWGDGDQSHKTTTENILQYSEKINARCLPQTILDAIIVTRALGFRYLWVDSLCIIQDSNGEDMRHELARMHLIYRHAFLTIVAASAKAATDGFLHTRDQPAVDQPGSDVITLPFPCPHRRHRTPSDNAVDRSMARRVGTAYVFPDFVSSEDNPTGDVPIPRRWSFSPLPAEPIDERAWCLQELHISPRTLIFGSGSLRFRCQTATKDVGDTAFLEDNGSIRLVQREQSSRLPKEVLFPELLPPEPGTRRWRSVYHEWGVFVGHFTQRIVRNPSDKLVACSAIAEAFSRPLDSEYLAGLWRINLLQELLWHRQDPFTSGLDNTTYLRRLVPNSDPSDPNYRAPSWSWAAVDGRIDFHTNNLRSNLDNGLAIAEVVRCEVVHKDPDLRFGEVTSGTLVLRAQMIQCKIQPATAQTSETCLMSSTTGQGAGEDNLLGDSRLDGRHIYWPMLDTAHDARTPPPAVWFIPLIQGADPVMEQNPLDVHLEGLLVARMVSGGTDSGGSTSQYRRIGYCSIGAARPFLSRTAYLTTPSPSPPILHSFRPLPIYPTRSLRHYPIPPSTASRLRLRFTISTWVVCRARAGFSESTDLRPVTSRLNLSVSRHRPASRARTRHIFNSYNLTRNLLSTLLSAFLSPL